MKNVQLRLLLLVLLTAMGLSHAMAQGAAKTGPVGFVAPPKTGDPVADEKAHLDAKTKWVKDNPEAYRAAGGDPEAVINPKDPNTAQLEVAKPRPAFSASRTLVLVSAEAVALPGAKVSSTDLAAESEGLRDRMPLQVTQLQQSEAGHVRLYSPDRVDVRAIETREGSKVEWLIPSETCKTCTKKVYSVIESESADRITYLFQDDDENTSYQYRMQFEVLKK